MIVESKKIVEDKDGVESIEDEGRSKRPVSLARESGLEAELETNALLVSAREEDEVDC